MATPRNGARTVDNPGLEVRSPEGIRRSAPAPIRRPRRWWIGLLAAALLVGLMIALAALEATTCAVGGARTLPCLATPTWVFYGLHAAATLCCMWSIGVTALALIEARNRRTGARPKV
jgi:hypothetical protein